MNHGIFNNVGHGCFIALTNTGGFNGILKYQQKQLANRVGGVIKQGVIHANKIIMNHLEKYKYPPGITEDL